MIQNDKKNVGVLQGNSEGRKITFLSATFSITGVPPIQMGGRKDSLVLCLTKAFEGGLEGIKKMPRMGKKQ